MLSDTTVGSPVVDASYRCVLTDLSDRKYVAVAGSAGQSAYHSLQSPYAHFGIGRSNNFIEQFTVAVFSEGKRVMRQWSPIIPKSILFIVINMNSNEQQWQMNLLSKPADKIPVVLLVDGLFLLLLGLIIIVLHLGEKAEDKKENE